MFIIDWQRVVDDLIARVSGPMHFRLLLQPAMAAYFGIRDGIRDSRAGRPAYFWSVLLHRDTRKDLIKEALKADAKVLIAAFVLDAIYQVYELHWFYPGEAIIVALILAFVPYLLIRGPANRVSRWWMSRRGSQQKLRTSKT